MTRLVASLFAVGLLCQPASLATIDASRATTTSLVRSQNSESNYISLRRVATSLGLRETPSEDEREVILVGGGSKLELEADSREVLVNRLRVFLNVPPVLRDKQLYLSRRDFELILTPILRPDLCDPMPPHPKVIVLDPGHGGIDRGAENKHLGLAEKECALDVAFRLRELLAAAGWRVVLTRERDVKVELADRAAIANQAQADLFVSIHFNSLPGDTETSGREIFTFTPQFQRSSRSWSPGEPNDAESEASPVNRFDQASMMLAVALDLELFSQLKTFDRGLKTAHFGMLRGLNCPAVLIESAFLSNEAEATRIATPRYRQQIAEAMLAGIRNYCATLDSLKRQVTLPTKP